MPEPDPKDLIAAFEGDDPRPEFVSSLEARLVAELEHGWDADRVADSGDDIAPERVGIDLEPESLWGAGHRPWRIWVGAAAAAVVLVVGLAALLIADGDEGNEAGTAGPADPAPTRNADQSDAPPPPMTSPAPEYPDFEFTVVEPGGVDLADDLVFQNVVFQDGMLWAVEPGARTIFRIDVATGTPIETIEVDRPVDTIRGSLGDLWASHDGALSRIDPSTGSVIASIPLDLTSGEGDPEDGDLWYGDRDAGVIYGIDTSTNSLAAVIEVEEVRAVSAGAGAVWGGDTTDGQMRRIDLESGAVATFEASTLAVGGFAAGPNAVWKGDAATIDASPWLVVKRFDPTTNDWTETIPIEPIDADMGTAAGIRVLDGSVWVLHGRCSWGDECRPALTRIDAATNTVVAVKDLPPGFPGVGMGLSDDAIWLTGDGEVARIDFSSQPDGGGN